VPSALKTARNAAASAMAWTLYHAPALEAPYAHVAHAARSVPGLHTLFREATDRLTVRLVRNRRQRRRVRIGPVAPVFDVSSFTVKGQYFAHVPYEPGATGAVLRLLNAGSVFIDIGANAGYFTVLAALRVGPGGRVIAFEPNPVVAGQLREQIRANAVEGRVTVADVALADRDADDVPFYVSCWPENDGISSLTPEQETIARGGLRSDATIPVSVRTLDAWSRASGANLARIDLVKIDVEGAEAQVLKGMSALLTQVPPPRIICETRPQSDAARLLLDRGYRMSMLDEIPGGIPNLLFEHLPGAAGDADGQRR
jgi:FkbM family methyltransferase